jgi:phosphatidylethanolamine/phosphatidyl-N-methylethanolamine N-methyltransferase
VSGFAVFTREFLRSPMATAAPVPTSAALSALALAPLPEAGDPVVLELGAGHGATTTAVQRRLGGRGRHIAVENNPRLAKVLREAHPHVEVHCEDAHDTVRRLASEGVRIDLVYSTLPWSATSPPDTTIFAALAPMLTTAGAVSQVQHSWVRPLPVARQVRRNLETHFEEVVVSRTVWRNTPPAVVFVARRPRVPAPAADAAPLRDAHPAAEAGPAPRVIGSSIPATGWSSPTNSSATNASP